MNRDEAIAYLVKDGPYLKVPCSRYGYDSASCAPVAWRVAELIAAETGEPVTTETLDYVMGLVVNDSDSPEYTLRHYGTEADWDEFDTPIFVVVENTPGYSPDTEPGTFQDWDTAIAYGRELVETLIEYHHEDGNDADVSEAIDTDAHVAQFYVTRKGDARDLGRIISVERIEE